MNKQGYIPQEQRKRILLLCDDIRLHSGIATMGKEFVIGTSHHYNWINLGGAINHPEQGQRFDLSPATNELNGINDADVKVMPISGYGNPDLIRQIIKHEKIDAILLFTDPRYWVWLFQIENEIRKQIPIMYLNIWDNYPAPQYNESFYESCDLLMGISKQTTNINKIVLGDKAKNKVIGYVPHGINHKMFFKITPEYEKYNDYQLFKKQTLDNKEYEYVVFYNARNIRRKSVPDLIAGYKVFCDSIGPEKAKKSLLLLHTQARDENGTDLEAVINYLGDEHINVKIVENIFTTEQMNWLYNIADVTCLVSSNEGWGLSLTESMMAGTMIIGNVTGGMQDQMRFVHDGKWMEFDEEFCSNHFGTYKEHGEWVEPVFPSNLSLVGSIPTPYIWDDRCDFRDIAKAIEKVYNLGKEERQHRGMKGAEWVRSEEAMMTAEAMSNNMIKYMDECFDKFESRPTLEFFKIKELKPEKVKHKLIY
jgi:hypothetical protein